MTEKEAGWVEEGTRFSVTTSCLGVASQQCSKQSVFVCEACSRQHVKFLFYSAVNLTHTHSGIQRLGW